jgi:hypothetical protein
VRGADRAASTQLADPGPQHTAFANGTADHSAQKTVPTVLATYWPPSGKRKFGPDRRRRLPVLRPRRSPPPR